MRTLTPDETILGLLAIQPRHGYELLECFRQPQQLGRVWNLSTSQLYNVLKRLESQRWVVGETVETESAPPRTEYTVTSSGRSRMLAWLYEPRPSASIRGVRVEFLSRLFIARQLGMLTEPIVKHQRDTCLRKLAELKTERPRAASSIDRMALELHIHQLEAVLQWITHCESMPATAAEQ